MTSPKSHSWSGIRSLPLAPGPALVALYSAACLGIKYSDSKKKRQEFADS